MSWKSFHGQRLIERTESAMARAVLDATEAIGMISDQQVPHDEGILQGSKVVKANPADKLEVAISYGGGAGTGHPRVPYAFKWHELEERTTGRTFSNVNFQKGRKSNYLRDPVFQQGPAIVMQKLREQARGAW